VTRTGKGKHPDSDVRFDNAPYFNFNDGKVKFDTNWFDNANDNYGSASGFVPKSLLHRQKSVPADALLLPRAAGTDPSAQHSADLVDDRLKRNVFLVVEGLALLHETEEEAQKIKLHARSFQQCNFVIASHVSCLKEAFDNVEYGVLATLVYREAFRLRNNSSVFVKDLIKLIRFLKNWDVSVIHR
jgi:hypothetical protein